MEFQKVIEDRRSTRVYQTTPVKKEDLDAMVEAAILAPSWKNSQTTRYHIITNRSLIEQINEKAFEDHNANNCKDVPVLVISTFVASRSGFERDGTPTNELGNSWGCYDNGLSNQLFILKAQELGISTLIMGLRDEAFIRNLLDIDESQTIVSVISVGYGDEQPEKPKRKTVDAIATYY